MNDASPVTTTTPIVWLDRIWKSFGRLEVLTDVSLSVPCADVGPSGAGKSTLLRCINHLETIDDGTIHFEGQPVYRYRHNGKLVIDPDRRVEAVRAQIGMVFQAFNLFPPPGQRDRGAGARAARRRRAGSSCWPSSASSRRQKRIRIS